MKKILPILILSAAAVFLLSSCDQMLEALFPSETGHGGSANNTITFAVSGYDQYNSTYGIPGPGRTTPSMARVRRARYPTNATHYLYVSLYQYANGVATLARCVPARAFASYSGGVWTSSSYTSAA